MALRGWANLIRQQSAGPDDRGIPRRACALAAAVHEEHPAVRVGPWPDLPRRLEAGIEEGLLLGGAALVDVRHQHQRQATRAQPAVELSGQRLALGWGEALV